MERPTAQSDKVEPSTPVTVPASPWPSMSNNLALPGKGPGSPPTFKTTSPSGKEKVEPLTPVAAPAPPDLNPSGGKFKGKFSIRSILSFSGEEEGRKEDESVPPSGEEHASYIPPTEDDQDFGGIFSDIEVEDEQEQERSASDLEAERDWVEFLVTLPERLLREGHFSLITTQARKELQVTFSASQYVHH